MGVLKGKVAIITGAAQGVGKAIAVRYAKEGAKVVIADLDYQKAEQTAAQIKELGKHGRAVKVNIAKKNEIEELIKTTFSLYGRLDLLVNNAAVLKRQAFLELSEENWDSTMAVNLKGTFLCSQAFSKKIIEHKQQGKIINIASICSLVVNPYADLCAYEVSKAGIMMLTKRLGFELAPYQINVNAVAPSVVRTRLLKPENEKKLVQHIPLGRIADPDEITGATVFLGSADSNYVTGTTLFVDGGWLTQ